MPDTTVDKMLYEYKYISIIHTPNAGILHESPSRSPTSPVTLARLTFAASTHVRGNPSACYAVLYWIGTTRVVLVLRYQSISTRRGLLFLFFLLLLLLVRSFRLFRFLRTIRLGLSS